MSSFVLIALFSWPLVSFAMFQFLPPLRALIWTILGGYLFLPGGVGIDLPLLPQFDKHFIPAVSAAVFVTLALSKEDRQARLRAGRGGNSAEAGLVPAKRLRALFTFLSLLLLVLPIGVYLTNGEPLVFENRTVPGVRVYDIFSLALSAGVTVLPFLLGRRYLRTTEAHREILLALLLGGIIYGLLMLVEMRLSPQLNRWVYGYFPNKWLQHVRGGAYRPIVFLDHGLRVAIFMAMAAIAGIGLARHGHRRWWLPALFVSAVLILSPNLGALLIFLSVGAVAAFARPRFMILAAAGLAAITLTYPLLRGAGLVPTERLLSMAESISADRAQSLWLRIDNEERLLAKANRKPVFGWGSWGRNRVITETGEDNSTTDGVWIIVMGTSGWTGYLAFFGILTLPLLVMVSRRKHPPDALTVALGMVLAANLVDLIPNSSLTPLTWLVAGALAGRLQWQEAPARAEVDVQRTPTDGHSPGPRLRPTEPRKPVYSRFDGPARSRRI